MRRRGASADSSAYTAARLVGRTAVASARTMISAVTRPAAAGLRLRLARGPVQIDVVLDDVLDCPDDRSHEPDDRVLVRVLAQLALQRRSVRVAHVRVQVDLAHADLGGGREEVPGRPAAAVEADVAADRV